MSTVTGKDGVVKVGTNTIAEVRSFTLNRTIATVEDTSMGDVWTTHKVTMKSWSGQVSCYWDKSDTTGQGALDVGNEVTLKLYPEGSSSGDTEYSGSAIISSIEKQVPHDGMVEVTFNFQGNGPLTPGAVA